MGYRSILAEGAEKILGRRSPNLVYRPAGCGRLKLLLRNYRLSDDVAFRFSDRNWAEYPLTAAKYAHWLHRIRREEAVINLFMDYETFGEHQWRETGIFDFLRALPGEILRHPDFCFRTPAEAADAHEAAGEIDCPGFISWADEERDTTAWLGNAMQQDAARDALRTGDRRPPAEGRRSSSGPGGCSRRPTISTTCARNGLPTGMSTATSTPTSRPTRPTSTT